MNGRRARSREWAVAAVLLVAVESSGLVAGAQIADTTPPTVVSVSVAASIDNASPSVVEFDVVAADDSSGVDRIHVEWSSPSMVQIGPYVPTRVGGWATTLVSGSALDGTWHGQASVPAWVEPGVWVPTEVTVYDEAGNPRAYGAGELVDANQFDPVVITGNHDLAPPLITGVTVTASPISNQVVNDVVIDFAFTDDASGVRDIVFYLVHESGDITYSSFDFTTVGVVAGTPRSGTYRIVATLPEWMRLGTWKVDHVNTRDTVYRHGYFTHDALVAAGVSVPDLVVTGPEDGAPPTVVSTEFTPDAVTNGTQVSVRVTFEDLSGVYAIGLKLKKDSTEVQIASVNAFSEAIPLESGTPHAGVFAATFTPNYPFGDWSLEVTLRDNYGNYATYSHPTHPAIDALRVLDPASRPYAPVNLVAVPQGGGIELHWDPPAYWGNSPLGGYRVETRALGPPATPTGDMVPSPDIMGGDSVAIADYPWQGALLDADEVDAGLGQFCGVTLIAPRVALTAAHCVAAKSPAEVSVAFGKSRLSEVTIDDRVPVVTIIVHPGYDPIALTDDIALLTLAAPPRGGSPIALLDDASRPILDTDAWASGWGVFFWDTEYYYLPDQLRAVELAVEAGPAAADCRGWQAEYDPQYHLCAGIDWNAWGPREGTCYGDSGGPLVVEDTELGWRLAGVTSFGPAPEIGDCGVFEYPSVFSRVTSYADWVDGLVSDQADWRVVGTTAGTSLLIDGLEPGSSYELRVTALSEAGGEYATAGFLATAGGAVAYYPWPVRLAGPDRYATAAGVSAATFPGTEPIVFVATGQGFADALAGAAVAGSLGAPLLLVSPSSVPAATDAELARLDPETVVILGGAAAVSDDVATQLAAHGTVVRLAGSSRYDTAVEISRFGFPEPVEQVVVATGTGFADALAGAPAATQLGGPVLLTPPTDLADVVIGEIQRLSPQRIVVLGGTAAVSDAVLQQLQQLAPVVVRLSGADRYGTAIAVNREVFPAATTAYVATGFNYPDALAGAAAAAADGAPLYLVAGSSVPAGLIEAMQLLGITDIVILGGTGVVGDQVRLQLGVAFGPT